MTLNKTIKALLVALTLAAVFGVGNYTGANSSWKIEVESEANKRISASGYNKKEELINSDVASEIKLALDPKIKTYEEEVADMLDEYFQSKLQAVVESPEGLAIEETMEAKKLEIYERYKADIDAMFGVVN